MSGAPRFGDASAENAETAIGTSLQGFLAAARGDDDFLEARDGRAGRVLRQHRRHGEHRDGDGRGGLHRVNGELLHGSPCSGRLRGRPVFQRALEFS